MMTQLIVNSMKMCCMSGALTSATGSHQAGQDLQPAGAWRITGGRHLAHQVRFRRSRRPQDRGQSHGTVVVKPAQLSNSLTGSQCCR